MADKSEPLDDKNAQNDESKDQEETNGDGAENHRQEMFDAIFHELMDGFGEACETDDVEVCVAIVKHVKFDHPIVFYRAQHVVEAGALMAEVLREIKSEVFENLSTEPK